MVTRAALAANAVTGASAAGAGAAAAGGSAAAAAAGGAAGGVVGSAGPVASLAGRLALGATAALVARADAYLGNDSGVSHLAAAVGTPVVVVFGPTSAARYGPVPGAGEAVAAGAAAGGDIRAVAVEAVWAAVARARGGVGRS